MKKIIVLLLVSLSIFSFSKNFEKKENQKEGTPEVLLILRENGNSYDFSMDFVEMGNMPRLHQVAGTAEKVGNKYVYSGQIGEITFNVQNNKVIVASQSVFDYAINGSYNFISNSSEADYRDLDRLLEEN